MALLKKIFRFYKSNLKNKILFNLFVATFVPTIVIFGLLFAYINTENQREIKNTLHKELLKCTEMINRELSRSIQTSDSIITNNYLIYNLKTEYFHVAEIVEFYNNLNIIFNSYKNNFDSGFTLYTTNKTLYESQYIKHIERLENNPFVKNHVLNSNMDIIWSPVKEEENAKSMIVFYRNVVLFNERIGLLKYQIPLREFKYIVERLDISPEVQVCYVTTDEITVLSDNDEWIGKKNSFELSENLLNGYSITMSVPNNLLRKNSSHYQAVFFLIIVILLIIVIYIADRISKNITGDLTDFINQLNQNEDLLLDNIDIQIDETDEIGIIKRKYKDILKKVNEIYKDIIEVKSQKTALEIELIQARLNPHLLYNSLSMLRWSAVYNNDKASCNMIDLMTGYFRSVLNKGKSIVSFEQEFTQIISYVKINEIARDSNYNLTMNIGEDIKSHYTLHLLLQPFVENCIIHGLNSKDGESRITINGKISNDIVIVEIIDNGYGIDASTIAEIVSTKPNSYVKGYGIKNTIKRIKLYFGDDYGITIESEKNKETKVTVKVPALSKLELENILLINSY